MGFLVKECLASGVELIKDVNYEESMGIKVKGERGRNTLFLGCVYMPTDGENVSIIESSYSALKGDVLPMKERGQVVLLGDFNARVEYRYSAPEQESRFWNFLLISLYLLQGLELSSQKWYTCSYTHLPTGVKILIRLGKTTAL